MAKNKSDKLFELFAGEYVQIIIDKDVEVSKQTASQVETMKSPMSINGYLVDVDDVYLYLGISPNAITQAIPRDFLLHIEISEEETVVDELIKMGEIPEKGDKQWN